MSHHDYRLALGSALREIENVAPQLSCGDNWLHATTLRRRASGIKG